MGRRRLRNKGVSGSLPKYGAIFMADKFTRKECFARKLFGLPPRFSDFVRDVKTGMPLFLFDYHERKLYGVFEAASDGAMNIVPNAYKSSGRHFPAQVRFSIMWKCAPVPECDFRDAIRENFFAEYKFNFGLSRTQVWRLLSLFGERKLVTKIPQSIEPKVKCKASSQKTKPVVESQPSSVKNSETLPNLTPEKSACLVLSDSDSDTNLDDYIPLPSIDPNEIENPLLDGVELDYIPLPSIEAEETDSDNPFPDVLFGEPCDAFHWDANSLVSKVDECLLKGDICSSESKCDNIEEGDKRTDNGSGHPTQGLYSDSLKNRTSVFLRLSGLPKLIEEKSHCYREVNDSRDVLKELDKKYEVCMRRIAERAPLSHEAMAIENRPSVFSRLEFNVGKALENNKIEWPSAGEMKQICKTEELPRKNLKRKISCTINLVPEVGCIVARHEKESNIRVSGKRRRTGSTTSSRKGSTEIRKSNSCSVPVAAQGCPASTVNTGSNEASSATSTIDDKESHM